MDIYRTMGDSLCGHARIEGIVGHFFSGRNRYLDIYWWKSFRYFHRKIEIRFFIGAPVEKRVIKDDPWIRRFS